MRVAEKDGSDFARDTLGGRTCTVLKHAFICSGRLAGYATLRLQESSASMLYYHVRIVPVPTRKTVAKETVPRSVGFLSRDLVFALINSCALTRCSQCRRSTLDHVTDLSGECPRCSL